MKNVLIFGLGDVARLAHFFFTRDSELIVSAFVVEDQFYDIQEFQGCPVVKASELKTKYPPEDYLMFVAIGYSDMNGVRARIFRTMEESGYKFANYISSKCTFLTEEPVGRNVFIMEDNTIQPFVSIGDNVILWSGNHVGHDAVIEDHCFITSHCVISGHTRIGAYSFIGVNATLRNSIQIGERTLIGAGAIIMKNTAPNSVFVPERTALFSKTSDQIKL